MISPLAVLLVLKMSVTLVAVAAPFLFLPSRTINRLSGFEGTPPALYRLYGMAILALIVGYGGGLVEAINGQFPAGVVTMGLVSNAGAAVTLIAVGEARRKPLSTFFFALIAVGLAVAALAPEFATKPL